MWFYVFFIFCFYTFLFNLGKHFNNLCETISFFPLYLTLVTLCIISLFLCFHLLYLIIYLTLPRKGPTLCWMSSRVKRMLNFTEGWRNIRKGRDPGSYANFGNILSVDLVVPQRFILWFYLNNYITHLFSPKPVHFLSISSLKRSNLQDTNIITSGRAHFGS